MTRFFRPRLRVIVAVAISLLYLVPKPELENQKTRKLEIAGPET